MLANHSCISIIRSLNVSAQLSFLFISAWICVSVLGAACRTTTSLQTVCVLWMWMVEWGSEVKHFEYVEVERCYVKHLALTISGTACHIWTTWTATVNILYTSWPWGNDFHQFHCTARQLGLSDTYRQDHKEILDMSNCSASIWPELTKGSSIKTKDILYTCNSLDSYMYVLCSNMQQTKVYIQEGFGILRVLHRLWLPLTPPQPSLDPPFNGLDPFFSEQCIVGLTLNNTSSFDALSVQKLNNEWTFNVFVFFFSSTYLPFVSWWSRFKVPSISSFCPHRPKPWMSCCKGSSPSVLG